MLSTELPALHFSKDSVTLLCGYTQPTVGLARPVLCIKLTPCYVESGVTATNAFTPDHSDSEMRHLQAKALCYHYIRAMIIIVPTQTLQRRAGSQPNACLQILLLKSSRKSLAQLDGIRCGERLSEHVSLNSSDSNIDYTGSEQCFILY